MTINARPTYTRRGLPIDFDRAWLAQELGNIQRAMPPYTAQTVRAAYTATAADDLILCDATSAAFAVTLPSAALAMNMRVTIKKIDASAHAVTVGATIDGTASPTLATQYKSMTVQSDGSAWYKLASI